MVMGIPGAGKTRLAADYVARGYVRLNRDERGGSLGGIARALDERLESGERRIVLDNTYLTRAARSHVIEVAARHGTARYSPPTVGISRATGTVAARLALPGGASVVTRHQELFIDEHPWSLQTSHYPMGLVERGAIRLLDAADVDEGILVHLEQTLGLTQIGYTDQILIRPPRENEVRFFRGLADGRSPIAVLLRTAFTAGTDRPEPYRLTETRFPAERTQFVIHEGQVPDRLAAAVEA